MRIPKAFWILALVAATMPFWDLGHPLWEVDDARYAEVPREMVENGDWLTPRLNYIDYLQKPPLIYWLGALSYSTFGVSEAAARAPLALLALLGLAGVWWLGYWLFSPMAGLSAAVILGTCAEFSVLSHLQTPDMALTVFLLWASAFALRVLRRPQDARWAAPACGAAMGLAFLSKGLVGLVFPGTWTAALAVLFPDLRKGFKSLCLGPAIPMAVAVIVPWVWAMTIRHPGFPYHFFIEHHFFRYLTPEFNRQGPWYYFIGVDLGGLLPWTPLAAVACIAPSLRWRGARNTSFPRNDPRVEQLALWVALVFAFFSASKSKLPTYILPIFPQQCLLAAALLDQWGEKSAQELWVRRTSLGLGGIVVLLTPVFYFLWPKFAIPASSPDGLRWTGTFALAVLGCGLLVGALLGARSTDHRRLLFPASLAGVLLTILFLIGARQAGSALSAKEVSAEILARRRPGDRIMAYDFYLHGVPFYTRQPVNVMVNWLGELGVALHDPKYQDRFGNDETIRALPQPGRATFVVVRRKVQENFLSLTPPSKIRETIQLPDSLLAVF